MKKELFCCFQAGITILASNAQEIRIKAIPYR
jgi:hypothetical protein